MDIILSMLQALLVEVIGVGVMTVVLMGYWNVFSRRK